MPKYVYRMNSLEEDDADQDDYAGENNYAIEANDSFEDDEDDAGDDKPRPYKPFAVQPSSKCPFTTYPHEIVSVCDVSILVKTPDLRITFRAEVARAHKSTQDSLRSMC